ncbi:hypothetical protein BKE38_15325 [Pseudoroseomonas deserti]|uniref:DUF983 domain-containing protein n=1 Tax=Teichococcus deserti TaxID=1817963 RepID=A0A1V2H1Q4_9PROT|nr:DUF983 domain-containing protein [Pseudoroseomonas deserti]ONG51881.1 hypothetical protein BKE38_15325 [Pseudoroseomonas deserti]
MDHQPQRWEPHRSQAERVAALPPLTTMLKRGAMNRCPVCGVGEVFAGYLVVVPACRHCDAPLGRVRADDAPPYFTIFIVGHVLLPGVFWVEKAYMPPMWLHMVVWLPLFTLACLVLLRPIKGATVGLMLRLGFGGDEDGPQERPQERSGHGKPDPQRDG